MVNKLAAFVLILTVVCMSGLWILDKITSGSFQGMLSIVWTMGLVIGGIIQGNDIYDKKK